MTNPIVLPGVGPVPMALPVILEVVRNGAAIAIFAIQRPQIPNHHDG
ncbi:MAG: hypothetical protein AAF685_17580 [Cyanobacteria bacterium P01_C01_bin.89]